MFRFPERFCLFLERRVSSRKNVIYPFLFALTCKKEVINRFADLIATPVNQVVIVYPFPDRESLFFANWRAAALEPCQNFLL